MHDEAEFAADDEAELTQPAAGEARQRLWEGRLLLATRILAGLELLKGLAHWAQLLGVMDGRAGSFGRASATWQGVTIYFAILDLVAAVGLWMAAPWGVVIWKKPSPSIAMSS